MHVKRVAAGNERVTQGKEYELFYDSRGKHIFDDSGDRMKPSSNERFWIKVEKTTTPDEFNQVENKEPMMKHLKIQTVTMINEQFAEAISSEQILDLISGEEAKVARLVEVKEKLSLIEKIKGESKAINKIQDRHIENIVALVAILDSREDQE